MARVFRFIYLVLLLTLFTFERCQFDQPYFDDQDKASSENGFFYLPAPGCYLPQSFITSSTYAWFDYSYSFDGVLRTGVNSISFHDDPFDSNYVQISIRSIVLSNSINGFLLLRVKKPIYATHTIVNGGTDFLSRLSYCYNCLGGEFLAGRFNGVDFGSGNLVISKKATGETQLIINMTFQNENTSILTNHTITSGVFTEKLCF